MITQKQVKVLKGILLYKNQHKNLLTLQELQPWVEKEGIDCITKDLKTLERIGCITINAMDPLEIIVTDQGKRLVGLLG